MGWFVVIFILRQSGYYQNTLVSVEGALLEWVDIDGGRHTHNFGHWSDDSKQDLVATRCNMHHELYINKNLLDLVERLDVGGTMWKGMDSATVS
jgi:hypothetical protein